MTPKRLRQWQDKITELQRQHDKAIGAYEQIIPKLKKFGVKSSKEAKALLRKLRQQKEELEQQVDRKEKVLLRDYKDQLGDM